MKLAVILLNLGAPDRLDAVEPFLRNMFSDRAILDVPAPVRWALARFIARRRGPVAREVYAQLGGGSPLLPNTRAQAAALAEALSGPDLEARTFVVMRYWHPRAAETAAEVASWGPDRIVVLPLYPQFSGTTSASSLRDWRAAAAEAGIAAPATEICCYPLEEGWIAALAGLTSDALEEASSVGRPRVLFSAHGLPKRVVRRGDPYQWQVERTVDAVVGRLARPALDWTICYQSRVGPLEWIGPSTETEIERAGRDGVPVVVVPVAFVSEHSETLVELDVEYRHLAAEKGVPAFVRVPAVSVDRRFIAGLAALVRRYDGRGGLCAGSGGRICPADRTVCPLAA